MENKNKILDELFRENLVLEYEKIMNKQKSRQYHNGSMGFNNFVTHFKNDLLNLNKNLSKKELIDMNRELKKEIINWQEKQKWFEEKDSKDFEAFIKGEIVITSYVKFFK